MFKPKEFSQSEYEFVSIEMQVNRFSLLQPDCNTLSQSGKSVEQFFRFIWFPVDWSGGHSTPAG
jgi:hypothetical protein